MIKSKNVNIKESIKTVTSNSFITARGLEDLSLKGRKLLYIAISQCKQNDEQFYTYEITVSDLAKVMGVTTQAVYKEADQVTDTQNKLKQLSEFKSRVFDKALREIFE